ncbi:MAG TPA: hypothetical protein VF573_09200 [Paraburkholderia sp.]
MTLHGTGPSLSQVNQMVADVTALIPQPATSAPPAVADSGAQGGIARYAMENHTHASKIRKSRIAVSAATYTWTYPTPFGAGVVPICNGIAETAPSATDLINIQIDGAPTNTQCTFRITRYQQSVVSLIGLTTLSLNGVPASVNLHLSAMEP